MRPIGFGMQTRPGFEYNALDALAEDAIKLSQILGQEVHPIAQDNTFEVNSTSALAQTSSQVLDGYGSDFWSNPQVLVEFSSERGVVTATRVAPPHATVWRDGVRVDIAIVHYVERDLFGNAIVGDTWEMELPLGSYQDLIDSFQIRRSYLGNSGYIELLKSLGLTGHEIDKLAEDLLGSISGKINEGESDSYLTESQTLEKGFNNETNPPVKPIILDIDGLGLSVTELSQSTTFVDGGDGLGHRTALGAVRDVRAGCLRRGYLGQRRSTRAG